MSKESDYFLDIMDDALETYVIPDEYEKRRHAINEKAAAIRSNLGPAICKDFDDLLSMIFDHDTKMAEDTFRLGFECGLSHENKETI